MRLALKAICVLVLATVVALPLCAMAAAAMTPEQCPHCPSTDSMPSCCSGSAAPASGARLHTPTAEWQPALMPGTDVVSGDAPSRIPGETSPVGSPPGCAELCRFRN